MAYKFDVKKALQVQPRGRSQSDGIPGVETPNTGAGQGTAQTATSESGAGAPQSGRSGPASSDTNNDALPANAGVVGSGIGFGVRNTRGAGSSGVLGGFGGGRSTPGAGQFVEDENRSDYAELDSSKRDLYLTGSHGLTSLYPAILLTSPRTSKIIDINTGLTSTPFIIDLNNAIKRSIESDVRNAIAQYSTILQLTTTQYEQNVTIAKQYADLCLSAAQAKDRLIALTNIINTNITSTPQTQNIIIDGKSYQFLKDLPDVISFVKTIHEEFSIEDFIEGSRESVNTKSLLQILKILYNQILLGSFYLSTSHRSYRINSPNKLWGQTNLQLNDAIDDLTKIGPPDDVDLTNTAIINFKNTGNTTKLADLVRVIQRDLILQASKTQISTIFSTPANTSVQEDLSSFIGQYKDSFVKGKTLPQYAVGYDDVDSFTSSLQSSPPVNEISRILVQNNGTKNFNVLDATDGHDYLLYNELAEEANSVILDNLTNFSNIYAQFADKLRSFYQIIFRDDETRRKCLSIIATNFISFFNSSITREEFTSEASGIRMGLLMAASVNDNISKKLFEFICSSTDNKVRSANYLLDLCDRQSAPIINNGSLETNPRGEDATSTGGVGWEDIQSDYLKNMPDAVGTSFGMFHTIAVEVERALASGKISSSTTRTSESLGLTRNARAFLFYRLFLDILSKFNFKIEFGTDGAPPADKDLDTVYIEPEIRITYKPTQANPVRYALERYNKTRVELDNELNENFNSTTAAFKNDVRSIYDTYLAPITAKIDEQEQNCLDLINLIASHSAQISQEVATLTSSINSIKNIANSMSIGDKESIMNAIQSEQAFLKKNIVDRYSYPLRGAQYLPSAIDHNIGQALNAKTAILTQPILNDEASDRLTRKFMVVVGIPTGLMENLRYQNTLSTKEHLYTIDLVFKNLQISQKDEDDNAADTTTKISKTFSTRIFVNEGYQLAGGADVVSSTLSNYQQIYDATKYKYIDDNGSYLDATPDVLQFMLGDRSIIENHLLSHYSKLFLKTTAGITLDEEAFDLVPQTRRYPDAAQDANYTSIVDGIAVNYPSTVEGQLNKERVLRDLSRSSVLAPDQHKTSMMTSKIFERIHVIPVNIDDIISDFENINDDLVFRNDLSFISVVAKISLAENQPPMILRQSPTRRSAAQASTDVAETFKQIDVRSQGADVVGINKMIETSSKFSGIMRGRT